MLALFHCRDAGNAGAVLTHFIADDVVALQVRYIQNTFIRLLEQLRIVVDHANYPPTWAAMNTGLSSVTGEMIFILFTPNLEQRHEEGSPGYPPFVATAKSIRTESDTCWDGMRPDLPAPATYFDPRDPRIMFDVNAPFSCVRVLQSAFRR